MLYIRIDMHTSVIICKKPEAPKKKKSFQALLVLSEDTLYCILNCKLQVLRIFIKEIKPLKKNKQTNRNYVFFFFNGRCHF